MNVEPEQTSNDGSRPGAAPPRRYPPFTLQQRMEILRLRNERFESFARIASVLGRREATCRDWYERDMIDAALSSGS